LNRHQADAVTFCEPVESSDDITVLVAKSADFAVWRGRCNLAGLAVGRRNAQTVAKRVERSQKGAYRNLGF